MTQEIHTRAIVLSSFNYQDYDRITTFYTEQKGLIKAILPGANRPKSTKLIFCQPLTLIELTYRPKKGDIHTFKEGKVLDAHLSLRDSYEALQSGIKLLDITSKSQFPEEPSSKIFLLLTTYLKKISSFKNPWVLVSSFLLKTLLLSGQWTLRTYCERCNAPLEEFFFASSSYYCKNCAPSMKLSFNLEEIGTLTRLIQEKTFKTLSEVELSKELEEKIEKLFLVSHH